ncbi:MAG: hypothetical protein CMH54_06590 [Myxococcales bacterium]|nr:hypothetical protein [Myxococcales bacterium]
MNPAEHLRTDVPILVNLPQSHDGQRYVQKEVALFEVTDDTVEPIEGHVLYAADPRFAQLGFTASGETAADGTRSFALYYNVSSVVPAHEWDASWATLEAPINYIGLISEAYSVQRELNAGKALGGRSQSGLTFLKRGSSTFAEGFKDSYQLGACDQVLEPVYGLESQAAPAIVSESDAFSASIGFRYDAVASNHDASITYRVFNHEAWNFMTANLTVNEDHEHPHQLSFPRRDLLSQGAYNARNLYLTAPYNLATSDTRGTESIDGIDGNEPYLKSPWDPAQRYLIVHNDSESLSDAPPFGWFMFGAGPVRIFEANDGSIQMNDVHGYSAQTHDPYGHESWKNNRVTYVWMSAENKEIIESKFDDMLPGAEVGAPQHQNIEFVSPINGLNFVAGDVLHIDIKSLNPVGELSAELIKPDQSLVPMTLVGTDQGTLLAEAWTFSASDPLGAWKLRVTSGAQERIQSFDVIGNPHPRLFFGPADLASLQARKDQPAYNARWGAMLAIANNFGPSCLDDVGSYDERLYADKLANLGLVQLMDPSQSHYEHMMACFWDRLEHATWNDFGTLQRAHTMSALAQVYDWFYLDFTPNQRKEIRSKLWSIAKRFRTRDTQFNNDLGAEEWQYRGKLMGNHRFHAHMALAMVTFAFEFDSLDCERDTWVEGLQLSLDTTLEHRLLDGSSPEGMNYFNYGLDALLPWFELMSRHAPQGSSQAAFQDWMTEMVYFDLYGTTPGGVDNYGGTMPWSDTPHSHESRTNMAYLASRLGSTADQQLSSGLAQWITTESDRDYQELYFYLWHEPEISAIDPQNLETWKLFDDSGIFVHRSSWANDATYVSTKSGVHFGGHDNPQQGDLFLMKDGLPYLSPMPYSNWKMTANSNTLLVDGIGQRGEAQQWPEPVSPEHSGQIVSVLADTSFGDVVSEQSKAYDSSKLTHWARELVILDEDTVVVHDHILGTEAMDLALLLHSFQVTRPEELDPSSTEKPVCTNPQKCIYYFEFESDWDAYTWGVEEPAAVPADLPGPWTTKPHPDAAPLTLFDLSANSWNASVDETHFVPHLLFGLWTANSGLTEQKLGYHLKRHIHAAEARSTLVMTFDTEAAWTSLSDPSTGDSGVSLETMTGTRSVVWPANPLVVTAIGTLSLTGAMGGRDEAELSYFARDVISLSDTSIQLIASNGATVSVYARLEDAALPRYAVIKSQAPTTLSLYCPQQPSTATLNGTSLLVEWDTGTLTLPITAGEHRLELDP